MRAVRLAGVLLVLLGASLPPAGASAQQGPSDRTVAGTRRVVSPPAAPAANPTQDEKQQTPVEQADVWDLVRKLRGREQTPAEQAAERGRRRMRTVAPFIGSKPSTGFVVGGAASVAFFRGEPETTHISSATGSATFSTRGQVLLNAKLLMFTRDDRGLLAGDNRFHWTGEDTYGLGANTANADVVNVQYDLVRIYETAYLRVHRGLFAGVGFHVNTRNDIHPGADDQATWETSPYVTYSIEHGMPLDSQTAGGTSINLLFDSRDNAINAASGWYANASYRTFFKGFVGGDSTWQELYLDARGYYRPTESPRHTIAFWLWGDLVTGGTAPYFDLPATGMDTFGRSSRGYTEGRFRGERLVYGEVEYRATLMASGLLGAVVFVNAATVTNLQTGEKLFDSVAPAGGAGLRLRMDKRSRTNLCFDVGWGKGGSRGLYLALQEAF